MVRTALVLALTLAGLAGGEAGFVLSVGDWPGLVAAWRTRFAQPGWAGLATGRDAVRLLPQPLDRLPWNDANEPVRSLSVQLGRAARLRLGAEGAAWWPLLVDAADDLAPGRIGFGAWTGRRDGDCLLFDTGHGDLPPLPEPRLPHLILRDREGSERLRLILEVRKTSDALGGQAVDRLPLRPIEASRLAWMDPEALVTVAIGIDGPRLAAWWRQAGLPDPAITDATPPQSTLHFTDLLGGLNGTVSAAVMQIAATEGGEGVDETNVHLGLVVICDDSPVLNELVKVWPSHGSWQSFGQRRIWASHPRLMATWKPLMPQRALPIQVDTLAVVHCRTDDLLQHCRDQGFQRDDGGPLAMLLPSLARLCTIPPADVGTAHIEIRRAADVDQITGEQVAPLLVLAARILAQHQATALTLPPGLRRVLSRLQTEQRATTWAWPLQAPAGWPADWLWLPPLDRVVDECQPLAVGPANERGCLVLFRDSRIGLADDPGLAPFARRLAARRSHLTPVDWAPVAATLARTRNRIAGDGEAIFEDEMLGAPIFLNGGEAVPADDEEAPADPPPAAPLPGLLQELNRLLKEAPDR